MNIFSRAKSEVLNNKHDAVLCIKDRIDLMNDGEMVIARYRDQNDNNLVKTIIGIKFADALATAPDKRVLIFSEIESGDNYIKVVNDETNGCLKISLDTGSNGVIGRILTLENNYSTEDCSNRISALETNDAIQDIHIQSLTNEVKYHVSLKVKDPQIFYTGNIERFNAALNSNYDISDNTKIVDIVDNNDSNLHLTTEIGLITSIQGRCLNWSQYFDYNNIIELAIDVKHRDLSVIPHVDRTIGLYLIWKDPNVNGIAFEKVGSWNASDNDYRTVFNLVNNFIADANDIILFGGSPTITNQAYLELTNAMTTSLTEEVYFSVKYERVKLTNNFNGDFNLIIDSGTCFPFTCSIRPQLFNLTKMFGAGNEPTILEFHAMFPRENYEYALNSVTGLKLNKFITTGFNNAKLIPTDLTNRDKEAFVFRNRYYLRHVDPNEIYYKREGFDFFYQLSGIADPDTSHTNSYYVDISDRGILHVKATDTDCAVYPILYNKNTTPNTEYRIYDYEEYSEYEMDLSWINLLKNQNGYFVFPDGLLSTIDGSVYDEITNEYAIKRCEIQNGQIVLIPEEKYPIYNPMVFACDFWGVKRFDSSAGNSPINCKIKYFSNNRNAVRFLLDLIYKNESRFVDIELNVENLYSTKADKVIGATGDKICYTTPDGSIYETAFDENSFESVGSVLNLLNDLTNGTVVVDSATNAVNSTNAINAVNATYDSNNVNISDKLIELENRIQALEQA